MALSHFPFTLYLPSFFLSLFIYIYNVSVLRSHCLFVSLSVAIFLSISSTLSLSLSLSLSVCVFVSVCLSVSRSIFQPIHIIGCEFANGPEYWGLSHVVLFQRLEKMVLDCLILGIMRYGSTVKWSNPGNGVVPSPRTLCRSCWNGSLQVTLDYSRQHIYIYIYIYIITELVVTKSIRGYVSNQMLYDMESARYLG